MGLRCCLGNLVETWQQILDGKTGIRQLQPFSELGLFPLAAIARYCVPYFPPTLTQLSQQIVQDALIDAGLTPPLPDCAIVIGSSRACQREWEQLSALAHQSAHQSLQIEPFPIPWLETLPQQAALAAARLTQTTAAVLAPMAACATGIWAIAQGYELLQSGQYERVIVGAIEAPITPLTLIGFTKMGALATSGCYPFDRDREGLVLGEGGAVLVLETEELANQRGAKSYGQILGIGLTCDSYHVSQPDPNNSSARIAIKNACDRAGLTPADIDYIHAHGTSTPLNDRREAGLIASLFAPSLAVSSTKGATGHTLGASGAIGAALSFMALQQQQLPPCVGLRHSDFEINLIRETRSLPIQYALSFSFGFGGQNAVLALGKTR
jgi:3-oxoacyl-[acyl-carrier-protein] synthase II